MGLGKTYSADYLADSNNNTGAVGQVLISTASGINWVGIGSVPGTLPGGPYLKDTTDTFTGSLTIIGDIRGSGQQLVLNAGESYSVATGQTDEYVYANAENGLIVSSSPDNWGSGWAGRNTTHVGKADGSSSFGGITATTGNFTGNVVVDNMLTIDIDDISTGENKGLKLLNSNGVDQQWNITTGQTGVDNDKFTIRDSTNDVDALTIAVNGGTATFEGGGTFGGNVTGVRGFFNSGATNVVATFTSTDTTAGIGLIDSTGNVELSASGNVFQVQPAGGVAKLTVSDSITKVSGMLNIVGSRSTYVDNAEDDTATAHIFTTDAEVGDFAQLAGSLVLQARVNDAIYRDIIFAGGLGTTANPVTPLMTILGEGRVGIGTDAPAVKLHINNTDTLTATYQKFTNGTATTGTVLGIDADGDFLINNGETKEIKLYTNDIQRVTIQSGGNVGINSTNPTDAKLKVLGNVILDSHSASDPDATSRAAYPAGQMFTHYDEANGVSIIGGQGGFAGTGLTIGEETGRSSDFKFIRGVSDTNGGAGAAEEFWVDGLGNSYFAGYMGIGVAPGARQLDVGGVTRTSGFMNTNNYVEKLLPTISFTNTVANENYDIQFGNVSFWGYIEVEITGTYSNQNTPGKLTKIYAVGVNPATASAGGIIYANEARVSDALGPIKDNIALGAFSFNGTDNTGTFAIRISHIVSSGNNYTVKVRVFTHGSNGANGASGVLNNLAMSAKYTATALSRQYVYYNDNVGIGTSNPSGAKLAVMGGSVGIGTTTPKAKLDVNNVFCVDSKSHTITDAFTTCLTVNLSNHTGCHVVITVFGDWGGHSSAGYRGEFFLQNGANAYAEPGIILRQDDNTSVGTDQIICQIVDPSSTANPKDFAIQIRHTDTTSPASWTGQLTYTVQGVFNSIQ